MDIRPDDELRADVRAALRRDRQVPAAEIAVRADSGIVWLLGSAEAPVQRTAAECAVEQVTGAVIIENRLTPRPPGARGRRDAVLRAVALQVLADRGLPVGDEIDVDARGGHLTVTGQRPASAQWDDAIATLASLPDVVAVQDETRVPQELSHRG